NNGIGFAIPSNMTKSIVAQLRASGKVKRGWLGVSFQVVTKEMAESLGLKSANGALVASVTAGGPADKGGIKDGDVIIQFDGKDITDTQRLPSIVANTPIGKT